MDIREETMAPKGITSQASPTATRFQQLDSRLSEILEGSKPSQSQRDVRASLNEDLLNSFRERKLILKRVEKVSNKAWLKLLLYTFLWLLPRITVFTAIVQLADDLEPCDGIAPTPGCFYFRFRARGHLKSTIKHDCPVVTAMVENGKKVKIPVKTAIDIIVPGFSSFFWQYDPHGPSCKKWVERFNQNVGDWQNKNTTTVQGMCDDPRLKSTIDKSDIDFRFRFGWQQFGRNDAMWMFVFLFADAVLHFVHDLLLILGFAERLAAKCGVLSVACNASYVAFLTLWAQYASEVFIAEEETTGGLCFFNIRSVSMFATVGSVFTLFAKFLQRFGYLLEEVYFGAHLYLIEHRVPFRIIQSNLDHESNLSDVTGSLILPKGMFAGDVAHHSELDAYLDDEFLAEKTERYSDTHAQYNIILPQFVEDYFKESSMIRLRHLQAIAMSSIIISLVPLGLTTIGGLFTEFWVWSMMAIIFAAGNIIRFGLCELLVFQLNIMLSGIFCVGYVVKCWIEAGHCEAAIEFTGYPEGPMFFTCFIGLLSAGTFTMSLLPIFVRAADLIIDYVPGTFFGDNRDIGQQPNYLEVVYMNLQFCCYLMCLAYFKLTVADFLARLKAYALSEEAVFRRTTS